ncbi:MAG: glycosyltransferase family 39 protein, partial [Candidatus Marinimicrobia bacterium]|nr:glycosyltransferase family 39 protein [Candidatus Neomarinimicrobiota bacterium]
PEQWVVVPLNQLFMLATGILVLLMGLRLFDRRVALLGTSIYFLSDTVWRTAIAGGPLALLTFWACLAAYTALVATSREREQAETIQWLPYYAVSVLAAIAAVYTAYSGTVVLCMLMLYYAFAFSRRGWFFALLLLAAFGVALAPWIYRNMLVSGRPFGLAPFMALRESRLFAGDTLTRTLAPSFKWTDALTYLHIKWMTNVRAFYDGGLRTLGEGVLPALFLATFFYRFVRHHVHIFRWALLLALFVLVVIVGFFGQKAATLTVILWPAIILYGSAFFFLLLERLRLGVQILRIGVISILVLLQALPLIFSLLPPRSVLPYPPYFPPFIYHVAGLLEPTEVLCTDMPWATAWYGNRTSIEMPTSLSDFYEINDYITPVSGLYMTTVSRDLPFVSQLLTGPYRTWHPIMMGRLTADFPLPHGFHLKDADQLFFTGRPRWQPKP